MLSWVTTLVRFVLALLLAVAIHLGLRGDPVSSGFCYLFTAIAFGIAWAFDHEAVNTKWCRDFGVGCDFILGGCVIAALANLDVQFTASSRGSVVTHVHAGGIILAICGSFVCACLAGKFDGSVDARGGDGLGSSRSLVGRFLGFCWSAVQHLRLRHFGSMQCEEKLGWEDHLVARLAAAPLLLILMVPRSLPELHTVSDGRLEGIEFMSASAGGGNPRAEAGRFAIWPGVHRGAYELHWMKEAKSCRVRVESPWAAPRVAFVGDVMIWRVFLGSRLEGESVEYGSVRWSSCLQGGRGTPSVSLWDISSRLRFPVPWRFLTMGGALCWGIVGRSKSLVRRLGLGVAITVAICAARLGLY